MNRRRFAWWPVRLYRIGDMHAEPTDRWVWLSFVTEAQHCALPWVWTAWEEIQ